VGAGRSMSGEEGTLIGDCACNIKKTLKFNLEQAMKTQRGSTHVALLLL
jgi:hypothetical protein